MLQDIQFQHLSSRSSSTLTGAFAQGTWDNIFRHWQDFTIFCKYFRLPRLPLCTTTLINFLQLYSESVNSFNTVQNVLSSIKTMSKLNGHVPDDSVLIGVKYFMLGLKREMGCSQTHKLPVTPQLLYRISDCVNFQDSFQVCVWAAMLFMFLGSLGSPTSFLRLLPNMMSTNKCHVVQSCATQMLSLLRYHGLKQYNSKTKLCTFLLLALKVLSFVLSRLIVYCCQW